MYKALFVTLSVIFLYCIMVFSKVYHIPTDKSLIKDTCADMGLSTNSFKQQENILKNRACIPQPVTKEFAVDTVENVQVDNNDYVRVIGYLVKYKWEGPESCNCYSRDPHDFDEHLYLSSMPDEHVLGNTFVCEITRKASPELRNLNLWNYKGQKVAVEGYAFIDPDHGGSRWRRTSVEVHPVVNIKAIE